MDFSIGLRLSIHCINNNYKSIFVFVDRLTKILYYKPVEVTMDILRLAKIINNMMI